MFWGLTPAFTCCRKRARRRSGRWRQSAPRPCSARSLELERRWSVSMGRGFRLQPVFTGLLALPPVPPALPVAAGRTRSAIRVDIPGLSECGEWPRGHPETVRYTPARIARTSSPIGSCHVMPVGCPSPEPGPHWQTRGVARALCLGRARQSSRAGEWVPETE